PSGRREVAAQASTSTPVTPSGRGPHATVNVRVALASVAYFGAVTGTWTGRARRPTVPVRTRSAPTPSAGFAVSFQVYAPSAASGPPSDVRPSQDAATEVPALVP